MRLKKITPINGFDKHDSDNARQNNYAWSMVEFDGYLYIGTGRNVVYRGFQSLGFEPTKSFVPENFSQASEIWRYPIHKHYKNKKWERVFKMPEDFGTCLFRCMVEYENKKGERALYGGSYYKDNKGYLLTSKNGNDWESIDFPLNPGYFIRPMIEFKGRLYAASCQPLAVQETTYLHSSDDPENGWDRVNTSKIKGEIFSMQTFNGYLYVGTMPAGGFAIWKSKNPESGQWELVVDKGAGDALNEIPMTMEEYNGYLYVGSGINGAIYSTDPDNRWVLAKGFDLIRISPSDKWEVIIGKQPIRQTEPTKGIRRNGIYESGYGNIFNPYCWSMKKYKNKLYIGTWDSAILYKIVIKDLIKEHTLFDFIKELGSKVLDQIDFGGLKEYNYIRWARHLISSFRNYPSSFGFDYLVTDDGKHFEPISIDGFNNEENYGIRNLCIGSDRELYIGTANPTQGCEVWKTEDCRNSCWDDDDDWEDYEDKSDDDDKYHNKKKNKNENDWHNCKEE